jgi:hypothetical protein
MPVMSIMCRTDEPTGSLGTSFPHAALGPEGRAPPPAAPVVPPTPVVDPAAPVAEPAAPVEAAPAAPVVPEPAAPVVLPAAPLLSPAAPVVLEPAAPLLSPAAPVVPDPAAPVALAPAAPLLLPAAPVAPAVPVWDVFEPPFEQAVKEPATTSKRKLPNAIPRCCMGDTSVEQIHAAGGAGQCSPMRRR